MKKLFLPFLILVFCSYSEFGVAQTKPKPKPKTTKAPVKKAVAKEINVYVCTSNKDKFYHKRNSCGALNKCTETIKNIKKPGELGKYKRKKCQRCFS